jgi:predicted nuclease of predicted toxin-antitoxin system
MKLLLDENMPHDFRYYLPEHEVRTVDYMGWKGKGNGELIALAKDDFDALITLDQKIPHQHNLTPTDMAVIILSAGTNNIDALRMLIPELLIRLYFAKRGEIIRIPSQQSK